MWWVVQDVSNDCIASSGSSGSRRPLQGAGIAVLRNIGELRAQ